MSNLQKLLNLALDSSAHEGEAINAFLALRRKPNISKYVVISEMYGETNGKSTFKKSFSLTVPAKAFDAVFIGLNTYSEKKYFTFSNIKQRDRIIDPWYLDLNVSFDTDFELKYFTNWFKNLLKDLNNES